MEDSFRVRVDKVFGTLGGGTDSSVGVSPSLWCLTDEEIERRKWNRNKEVPGEEEDRGESGPSVVLADLESDLNELSDDKEDEEEEEEEEEEEDEGEEIDGKKRRRKINGGSGGGESSVDEYLDVQSNIGRDCTLDFEEEEDEFDKVAVGAGETGDRVYMRNVKYADYQIDDVSGCGELPSSLQVTVKDPRANHSAAKLRLREDAEAAGDLDGLQLSESSMVTNLDAQDIQKEQLEIDNPKPILKKRENLIDAKTPKRVRFMVDSESSTHEDQQSSGASDMASEPNATNALSVSEQTSDPSKYSGVPDHVRNPSKYTHYTFDSSDDMDDELNREACVNLFHDLRRRSADTLMEETPAELPKSIVFTPKKKPEHESTMKTENELKTREDQDKKRWSVEITADDAEESEISAMEEDGLSPDVDRGSRKPGRQYRTKANDDIDHSSN